MTNQQDVRAGVRPGDVLAGKYRVERVLGAGGMGVVVAAHHLQLDQRVALKFLLPNALSSADAVGRFVREARAAVRITGEHVARVSDVGYLESGSPYIVMEYLEGLDLSAWLKQRGALPIQLAVDFVLQACEAIAEAHALGIVHRDLKPANLFCVQRADGQLSIKVLDFGISKVTTPGGEGHDMTRTSALMGSPFYMSPEQLQSSKSVDARSDIWSLGIILFELVSGRVPFAAQAVTELAIKIAMDPAPPAHAFRADVPLGLERVIATCLEKNRDKRYPTVGELAIALADYGSKQAPISVERVLGTLRQAGIWGAALPPSGALPAALGSAPVPRGSVQNTASSWGHTGAGPGSSARAVVFIGVAVAVMGMLAVGGALILRKGRPSVTAPSAAAMTPPPVTTAVPAAAQAQPSSATAEPSDTPTLPASASPAASASTVAKPATPRAYPAATPPIATPTAKGNCDPPYYYNAKGTKVFKQECL